MLARRASQRLATFVVYSTAIFASAQTAYFADGDHGGVYGHYPPTFTQFMVDSLRAHPDWKLNLEIEPETLDVARTNMPDAYAAFKGLAADQTAQRHIEFVNPACGQSFLWNISGESIIQQFERGIAKIREHFPNAQFTTYSSEEPCFTSALPGILNSFGFKNAVLKNPNTCWGGHPRFFSSASTNFAGELMRISILFSPVCSSGFASNSRVRNMLSVWPSSRPLMRIVASVSKPSQRKITCLCDNVSASISNLRR